MSEELNQDPKRLAGQYYKDGYNCAEAILRAFRDSYQLDVSDEALKMATGFGGGVGHSGCMCGALTASVMVLGAMEGRKDSSESRDGMYSSAAGFHDRFAQKFGGTCCRSLNPHPFDTKEHLRNCLKITGNTAGTRLDVWLTRQATCQAGARSRAPPRAARAPRRAPRRRCRSRRPDTCRHREGR